MWLKVAHDYIGTNFAWKASAGETLPRSRRVGLVGESSFGTPWGMLIKNRGPTLWGITRIEDQELKTPLGNVSSVPCWGISRRTRNLFEELRIRRIDHEDFTGEVL